MQQKVQLPPFSADPIEGCLQLTGDAYIARQQKFAAKGLGDRFNIGPRFIVQIGRREFSTRGNEGTRATGSNAGVIRDADDEAAFTL
jgi:hypothetical protein